MKKFILKQTSFACPEQYDVFFEEKQVGYLRVRNGYFRCYYPDYDGEIIFEACTDGNGMFTDEERDSMIRNALTAIFRKLEPDCNI